MVEGGFCGEFEVEFEEEVEGTGGARGWGGPG